MPKKQQPADEPEGHCTYASVKIDDAVLPLARAAAALSGNIATQEFISDAVNRAAAEVLGRKPIHRRPPPTR